MKYLPLNNDKEEIRVLTIFPEVSISVPVRCKLENVSLRDLRPEYKAFVSTFSSIVNGRHIYSKWQTISKAFDLCKAPQEETHQRFGWGDYTALSYTWGDPFVTKEITVNGHGVQVTVNLEAALRTLSSGARFSSIHKLWVDALCINQQDDKERAVQVGKMGEIYRTAWTVLAWLGTEGNDSDKAFDLIEALALIGVEDDAKIQRLKNILVENPDHFPLGSWSALNHLFRRPYWLRLWVVQELSLGSSDVMMLQCGRRSISWHKLCGGLTVLHRHLWIVKNMLLQHEQRRTGVSEVVEVGWVAETLHYVYKDLRVVSQYMEECRGHLGVENLLKIAQSAMASDKRDKVYGLIGLLDPSIAEGIKPDYGLQVREVYTAIAKRQILTTGKLDILREGNPWGATETPSWVPDWTWNGRVRGNSFAMEFDASRLPASSITFSEDGTLLTCGAIILDKIENIGARESEKLEYSTETVDSRGPLKSAYGNFDETQKAFCYALVGGRTLSGQAADDRCCSVLGLPRSREAASQTFQRLSWKDFIIEQENYYRRWINWCQANKALWIGNYQLQDYFTSTIPVDASNEDYHDAYASWAHVVYERRLAVTSRGYISWTPDHRGRSLEEQTQKGDLICIVLGCSTPLVIRPRRNYYQVVGDSYVQGVMNGEVFDWLKAGIVSVQTITFC